MAAPVIYRGKPYATALEALAQCIYDQEPTFRPTCPRCLRRYPLVGESGRPSLVCPACGGCSTEASARASLAARLEREADLVKQSAIAEQDSYRVPPHAAPPGLDDVIGNADAVMQIRTALDAHRTRMGLPDVPRHLAFPHLLFSGPGGTGKTMLSEIVARELGRKIHLQMGQALSTPAKVAEVLLTLGPGEILFIDEIHGLKPASQEALYRAMEDGVLIPVTGRGQAHTGEPLRLPPFTLIGATTDEWALLPSLCQRFKYRVRLQRLTPGELSQAIGQRAARLGWQTDAEALELIGRRALGTPRLAVGLLDGCMDTAMAQGQSSITADLVRMTCEIWGLDGLGLDKVSRQYLSFLSESGGPVRLNVLATRLDGLSRRTVETKIEPDLVWLGLVAKNADGRRLTVAGREHLESVTGH